MKDINKKLLEQLHLHHIPFNMNVDELFNTESLKEDSLLEPSISASQSRILQGGGNLDLDSSKIHSLY
jgi:hypothetical protein